VNTPLKRTPTLMIQGTTSDAGKSTLVTGLCRLFARRNIKVAPFKPQNMALNSAVTPCGGEIGRAQAVQAKAANVALDVDFNPILLKPNSDTGAQVIIHGKALTEMEAGQYQDYKKIAMQAVVESHQRLENNYELIVVEGAGSPAEINLREGDVANMGFAEKVDCPVIIIADIDKGGVFAHLVGTLLLLSQSEQDRVIGFVINRFRGDINLLTPGLTWLEERTDKPVLGVLPYLHGLEVASEDAVVTQQLSMEEASNEKNNDKIKIVVLIFPRTSNHTDFDALRLHPNIDCQFLFAKDPALCERTIIPACDLIILPGSKSVRADLAFLQEQQWHTDIKKHLRYGGKVFGICGGYQMLGELIADPSGIEGPSGESEGLGYLPITTTLQQDKTLKNVVGELQLSGRKVPVSGYEIHAGTSTLSHTENDKECDQVLDTLLIIDGEPQGLINRDNNIAGCYLHGLFDEALALQLFLTWLDYDQNLTVDLALQEDHAINRLADACEEHLDIEKIEGLLGSFY
jgi:adenosylcobyric acid synthase